MIQLPKVEGDLSVPVATDLWEMKFACVSAWKKWKHKKAKPIYSILFERPLNLGTTKSSYFCE